MNVKETKLKVRIKHLAAEAKIIKTEERKAKGLGDTELLTVLHLHRVGPVRVAARHAHLAYAALRGTPYQAVEGTARTSPNWSEVRKIALRFGCDPDEYERWREGARQVRTAQAA